MPGRKGVTALGLQMGAVDFPFGNLISIYFAAFIIGELNQA